MNEFANKMSTSQLTDIFNAMASPAFYPHAVSAIEQRDTHISKVFLTGDYAYKIKKPVYLEFLDFTTLKKRKYFCRQELILNRRLAPDIYLDVVPITFKNGRYYLDGPGKHIEYTVKMRQLPENLSLLRLVRRGKLNRDSLDNLARILAKFYSKAPTSGETDTVGSWQTVRTNTEENFRQTEMFVGQTLDERMYLIIRAATRAFLQRRESLFQRRLERRQIRDCHGDLRAGHIYFFDGIQIIDCIEFNDRFRYGDIASDLAFLAMDLDYEGYPQVAQHLINLFIEYTKDQEMLILLDFYKCYRAYVRVKVNCFHLLEDKPSANEKAKLLREIDRCLNLAYRYAVQFTRPTIWVVCGLPASGKSTIANELAAALGLKVLRSDVVRKELFGLQPEESRDLPFEEGIYSKEAGSLAYGKLLMLAQEEIEKGRPVILDATFGTQHQRDEVIRLARDEDANILFIECVSAVAFLKKRLNRRKKTAPISNARLHHLKQLMARFESMDELRDEIHLRVNTNTSLDESMRQILAHDYIMLSRQTADAMKLKECLYP